MRKVAVLGGGRMGRLIAHDLVEWGEFDVTVYDGNHDTVKELRETLSLKAEYCDFSLRSSYGVTRDYHIVVNALPDHIAYATLQRLIEQMVPFIVCISFMPENPLTLDHLARKNNVTMIVDAGVAPGLNNLILGMEIDAMDEVRNYVCEVGGLPKAPIGLWSYKATFAPSTAIEEYTRPVKLMRWNEIVTVDPLTDVLPFHCPEHNITEGLVSFNTDGLRTLLHTVQVPNMTEKTIRHDDHYELIRVMYETGLFDPDVRAAVEAKLFPHWKFGPNDKDYTIMRVRVEGMVDGEHVFAQHTLFDEHDGKFSSMARTTGYTAAAFVRLWNEDIESGVHGPETLAKDFGYHIISRLAIRGVHITVKRGRA